MATLPLTIPKLKLPERVENPPFDPEDPIGQMENEDGQAYRLFRIWADLAPLTQRGWQFAYDWMQTHNKEELGPLTEKDMKALARQFVWRDRLQQYHATHIAAFRQHCQEQIYVGLNTYMQVNEKAFLAAMAVFDYTIKNPGKINIESARRIIQDGFERMAALLKIPHPGNQNAEQRDLSDRLREFLDAAEGADALASMDEAEPDRGSGN